MSTENVTSIDQHEQVAAKPQSIECFNPATGEKLGDVAVDTPEDVKVAVEKARVAQRAWGQTSFKTPLNKSLIPVSANTLAIISIFCCCAETVCETANFVDDCKTLGSKPILALVIPTLSSFTESK